MLNTRIVIAAAGEGNRWGGYLGVPKHLIPVMGLTLLERLVSQFSLHGDVTIIAPPGDDRYQVPGAQVVTPTPDYATDANKVSIASPWWNKNGLTLHTYGDLILEDAVVDAALRPRSAIALIGRWNKSAYTGKPYGEPFVWAFYPDQHAAMADALATIDRWHRAGRIDRSSAWELFNRLNGAGVDTVRLHPRQPPEGPAEFIDLDGWSEDFDFPRDWDVWKECRIQAGLHV